MSETYVSHTKPWSRMQSLSESRGGSKVTKPIFSNSIKRYLVVKNQPRSQRSLLLVFMGENLGTRFVKNKEEVGVKREERGKA